MINKLNVKNDFIFKRVFGHNENKDILRSLLQAILNVEITNLEIIHDTKLEKDRIEDKQCILDIRATFEDGKNVNIEIQLLNQFNMDKRTLYYWSKMYVEQLKQGENFSKLKKTITINILDFNFIKEIDKYHTTYHLREDEFKESMLTDILELHFIEIPKFEKMDKPNFDDALERWLLFIDNASEEVLEMLQTQDPAIKKASSVLDYLANDEETMRLYEQRQKVIHDEVTRMEGAKEEGRKEGLEKGHKEGVMRGKLDVAFSLLKQGVDIKIIIQATGLTREEIENIPYYKN